MKKYLLSTIIAIISLFVLIPNIYAINYYNSVNIKTVFEENIDVENIESIEVVLEDSSEYSKEYLLEKDKNFSLNLENIPSGPIYFRYGVVNNDEIGYYNVSADINLNEQLGIAEVVVTVVLQNNEVRQHVTLTPEDIEKINGSSSTTNKINDDQDEDSEVIIDDDDRSEEKNDKNKNNEEVSDEIKEAREKEARDKEKAETRKKNKIIGRILFSIIGIFLLIAIIFVAIKISRANK